MAKDPTKKDENAPVEVNIDPTLTSMQVVKQVADNLSEAKKQVAQAEGQAKCSILKAESEAKANLLLASSVTTELIQWQAVQKWDGKLPHVNSGVIPFFEVKYNSLLLATNKIS